MQYADMNLHQANLHGRNRVAMDDQSEPRPTATPGGNVPSARRTLPGRTAMNATATRDIVLHSVFIPTV
jgi:hypothetical protein